ncbi:hypothetical protein CES85_1613 [Ochrobactrum quorumnocens]|uniref:Uncharacterized protein n=1 Tax=Ochrobactrum quorumnocens TaxID=271865 RepID=A0A248UGT1_9HYPH|nr:hypothetical protein CES85_1613 [[Ochrobactrum] quorumnocens]
MMRLWCYRQSVSAYAASLEKIAAATFLERGLPWSLLV